ncbi:hypothetical protein SD457_05015 [Coprobacillaceae bacterium CR2/5/TPMF4]|nr:hypothetical protein SD457_05015 [Coprobacillaceae bacterium CR2/5/TPMF4]
MTIDSKAISLKSMLTTISNYKMANVSPQRALELAGQFEGEIKRLRFIRNMLIIKKIILCLILMICY